MNPRWNNFLLEAGARIAGGRVEDFGNPPRELQVSDSGDVLADLGHRGLIGVHGPDAAKFLQGQFTNDINLVDEGHSQLSGYCSPKGRLLALLRVFRRDDAYYLQLPRTLLDATLARLKKYVLMSRVTLEDAGESLIGIGLTGPRAEAILGDLIAPVPGEPDAASRNGALTVLRLPGKRPRFALYGPSGDMEHAWTILAAQAAPVGPDAWDRHDILAGIPDVHPATVDEFIPQTVNLELLGGISFKKGCYTGQEIIARLHYRGSVKRRMHLGHAVSEPAPAPGTPLHVPGDDGQAIGHVVYATLSPAGGCDLLAVVSLEHSQDNNLYIEDNSEATITLRPPEGLPAFG
ncbi:MAG: folate-binding protein YgfZ [Gammaproteobacteria bacterium]|nr:folate-binding protein YgfZ [Gammaproteobacteria bacterium]